MDTQKYFDMFPGIKLCVSESQSSNEHSTTLDGSNRKIKDEMCEILCRFSVVWQDDPRWCKGNFRRWKRNLEMIFLTDLSNHLDEQSRDEKKV